MTIATFEVSGHRHANTCDSQGSAADAIPAKVGEYAGGPFMMYAITGSCGPASTDREELRLRTEPREELSCGRELDC